VTTGPAIPPTADEIVSAVTAAMFGKPLVTNVFRSLLVEAMVAHVLAPGWSWCASDYSSWDFQTAEGLRLEVKQSAARQTWTLAGAGPSAARFDIAHRQGSWEGPTWIHGRQRFAQIYILAHHAVAGLEADHRDPLQWVFYVIAAHQLPQSASIGLATVRRLAEAVPIDALAAEVGRVSASFVPTPALESHEDLT
jgi:hypothetical protein